MENSTKAPPEGDTSGVQADQKPSAAEPSPTQVLPDNARIMKMALEMLVAELRDREQKNQEAPSVPSSVVPIKTELGNVLEKNKANFNAQFEAAFAPNRKPVNAEPAAKAAPVPASGKLVLSRSSRRG